MNQGEVPSQPSTSRPRKPKSSGVTTISSARESPSL
jgi:hypothetical protein